MPSWDSETTPNPSSTASTELKQVIEHLSQRKLSDTVETLSVCVGISDDPPIIAEHMEDLDYQLLQDTADHLSDALDYVQDSLLRSKHHLIDSISVAIENLRLVTKPLFDRRNEDDALTLTQANRFALQTYTANELVRQNSALTAAHRALNNILSYLSSNPVRTSSTSPKTSIRTTNWKEFLLNHLPFNLFSNSTDSSLNTASQQQLSQSDSSEEPSPLDLDESDIVWGDSPSESQESNDT